MIANEQPLSSLIAALSSSDNAQRQLAEHQLESKWIIQSPDELLCTLVQLARQSSDPNFRGFCLVLLRRLTTKNLTQSEQGNPWDRASGQTQDCIRSSLLECLEKEDDHGVRKKTCDAIAQISRLTADWKQLQMAIASCWQSPKVEYRESAFWIIAAQPEILFIPCDPDLILDSRDVQELASVCQTFQSVFVNPQEDTRVKLACFRASVHVITHYQCSKASRQALTSSLVDPMLSCMISFFLGADLESVVESLSFFIDLAENVSKSLKPILSRLIPFLSELIKDSRLDSATRQTALEVAVTLAEQAPVMCRKLQQPAAFTQLIIPYCLRMMTEIDADISEEESLSNWLETSTNEDDDDLDSNHLVAEQELDRLACALGGNHVLMPLWEIIPQFILSNSWRERHAALMCLSAVAEGCAEVLLPELDKIVEMIMPLLVSDKHPRVKYAACNAIGQMCSDFSITFQEKFHSVIVPGLCANMDLSTNVPRVACHAAAALVNFCEGTGEEDIVSPYLENILSKLDLLLQCPKKYVQEQTITTLATLANVSGSGFVKYYNSIMTAMISILRQHCTENMITEKDHRILRGKTIECATLMALAVGKELFVPYSLDFINLMISIQNSATEPDDPQVSYLLSGWARICKVLGSDFLPYFPMVMKPLLETAAYKPDFALLAPGEDGRAKGFTEEDGWQFSEVDGQQLGIKTTALEEKCTAIEMLVCYASELKGDFAPYASQVYEIVKPLLKFFFHEGIRLASAALLPPLLNSMKLSGNVDDLREMWQTTSSSLLHAIDDETDPDCLLQFINSFNECLIIMGDNSLHGMKCKSFFAIPRDQLAEAESEVEDSSNRDIVTAFVHSMGSQVDEIVLRVEERTQQRLQSEEYDNEIESELQQYADLDESILEEVTRCVNQMLKTHSSTFAPDVARELFQIHLKAQSLTQQIQSTTYQ